MRRTKARSNAIIVQEVNVINMNLTGISGRSTIRRLCYERARQLQHYTFLQLQYVAENYGLRAHSIRSAAYLRKLPHVFMLSADCFLAAQCIMYSFTIQRKLGDCCVQKDDEYTHWSLQGWSPIIRNSNNWIILIFCVLCIWCYFLGKRIIFCI